MRFADFGMPTLVELKSIEENAALCRELGLRFVELNMNLPQCQIEKMQQDELLRLARMYGIYFTLHLDENISMADFNGRVAQAYLETVLETLDFAKILAIPVLNLHLNKGVCFALPDKSVCLFEEYQEEYLKKMLEFRDACTRAVGDGTLKICVENTDGYTAFQVEVLDLLLQSPVFNLTFDIGHSHSTGGFDETIIRERAARLSHMHIHDAAGVKNHLALGTGEVNLARYLELASIHSCRMVLETKSSAGLRQSVFWLDQQYPQLCR